MSLIDAFIKKDLTKVKTLINNPKTNINESNEFGSTLLHLACINDCVEIVSLLVADNRLTCLNKADSLGRTAAHHACRLDESNVLKVLMLTNNINLLAGDTENNTPVHIAGMHRKIKNIEVLIKHLDRGIWQVKNLYGHTPFYEACKNNCSHEVIKLFADTIGLQYISEGDESLHAICKSLNSNALRIFLQAKINLFQPMHQKNSDNMIPQTCALVANNNCNDYRGWNKIATIKEFMKFGHFDVNDYLKNEDQIMLHVDYELYALIGNYIEDPKKIRLELLIDENINVFFLMLFLSHGYFSLKKDSNNFHGVSFMRITGCLPLEIQMMIIHRLSGSPFTFIKSSNLSEKIGSFVDDFFEEEVEMGDVDIFGDPI